MRRLVFALLLCACSPKEYKCQAARECISQNGGRGLCLEMHCAYEDKACASRFRFDDTAGDVANQCVDERLIPGDAGPADAAATEDAGLPDAPPGAEDAAVPDGPLSEPVDAAVPDAPISEAVVPDAETQDV